MNFTKDEAAHAVKILSKLAAEGGSLPICTEVGMGAEKLGEVMVGWPKHSGDPYYPVYTGNTPEDSEWDEEDYSYAEQEFDNTDNYWAGEVGELRVELCHYLIQKFLTHYPELGD